MCGSTPGEVIFLVSVRLCVLYYKTWVGTGVSNMTLINQSQLGRTWYKYGAYCNTRLLRELVQHNICLTTDPGVV